MYVVLYIRQKDDLGPGQNETEQHKLSLHNSELRFHELFTFEIFQLIFSD